MRDAWRPKDPLIRLQLYLKQRGLWTEKIGAQMDQEITAELDRAWQSAQAEPPASLAESLSHVFAEMTPRLRAQTGSKFGEALMGDMAIVEAVRDALEFEMGRDDRVVVLGEDVGGSGGVFRATENLQKRFGTSRVFDMPLAESAIVGSALGVAHCGPCAGSRNSIHGVYA